MQSADRVYCGVSQIKQETDFLFLHYYLLILH